MKGLQDELIEANTKLAEMQATIDLQAEVIQVYKNGAVRQGEIWKKYVEKLKARIAELEEK